MKTTSTAARIANDSSFCEAYAAMDKIVERLLTMAGEGATADHVTQLRAVDRTALLRELLQGYLDRCADSLARYSTAVMRGVKASVSAIGAAYAEMEELQPKHGIKQVDRFLSNKGIDVAALTPAERQLD